MDKVMRAQHISWRDLDDHIVILDSKKMQMVHHLEGVSAFLWRSLSDTTDMKSLVELVCNEYEVDEKIAFKDTNDFLQKLQGLSLLEK